MTLTELKKVISEAGVVGAGGAGFPSYAKLSEKAEIIILNCAECEPLFKLHRQLLEIYSEEIVTMLDVLTEALGAKEFIVAVKGSYKGAVSSVNQVIKDYPKGKIKLLKEMYPAGDEVVTIYESTGRVVPPGSIPIEVGCVVYNVETVLNMYKSLKGIENLIKEFSQEFSKRKKEKNMVDFNDIEHFALKILLKNEDR